MKDAVIVGGGLAGPLPDDAGVLGYSADYLHTGPERVDPRGQGHRDAEGIGGDVALLDELAVHRECLQGPRDLHRHHPHLVEQGIRG